MTTPQLPLGLRFPGHQRFEGFVPGVNAIAVAALQNSLADPAAPWVYLSGPDGSGKSHLLIACCQAAEGRRVQYLPLTALGADAESALMAITDFDLLCIDDVHAIVGHRDAEIALFDVFNRGRACGGTLALAGRKPVPHLALELPDLASRLRSCAQFALKPLDEAARRDVLRERAASRGFELDDATMDFLFRRHARDLGALLELLDRVDRESLAEQRRVTVPFLRRIMGLPARDPPGRG